MNSTIVKSLLLFLGLVANVSTYAWTVSAENSSIHFISIKKTNIGESHVFTEFSGSISDGKAHVIIKPDSVDTRVPIRNERMREFLFETGIYPTIEVTANVQELLDEIIIGTSMLAKLPATLSMHGESQDIILSVRVTAISDTTLAVTTVDPVLVRAANFNMVEGIQKLSSLVNDLAIAESIPVSFSLTFNK